MKLTLRLAAIAAGLAATALPALRAADETQPSTPPPAGTANATAGAEANREPRWRRDPMERLHRLAEALNLTQEQKDQVAGIVKGNEPQRQAIFNDTALSPDDKRTKMRELMDGTRVKIRALLTPEQQQKFDAMPQGGRERGPGHNRPPPPPAPADAPPPPPPAGST